MPPSDFQDGGSIGSLSTFGTSADDLKAIVEDGEKVRCVTFQERANRYNYIDSLVADFREDLWYNQADYSQFMEENWEIVDLYDEGIFEETALDTFRGLEHLGRAKAAYVSTVYAVLQEQERLKRKQGDDDVEKLAQTSRIMSNGDRRNAFRMAERDSIAAYGKRRASKLLIDSKSDHSTSSESISSTSSASAKCVSKKSSVSTSNKDSKSRRVYVSPIKKVKNLWKRSRAVETSADFPLAAPQI